MWLVAALTFASGVVVAVRMRETRKRPAPAANTSCVDLAELDSEQDAILVDVRSPEEFAGGHVTGAVNIPLDALAQRASELRRDAHVVTICAKGGGRSERAAELLRTSGFAWARSLCGGTQAWMQRNAAREAVAVH